MEAPSLGDHRGDDASALIDARLDDLALAPPRVIGGELKDFGLKQDGVEELGDALLLERRDLAEDRGAAPLFGLQAQLRELGLDPVHIGFGQVDFVDGDDNRDLGGLGVVDGLAGLGHYAVVRGDDEDDDVGDIGAAGPHLREGRMARGIEEGDPALGRLDLVGADVLRDPAELASDDVGLADRVEELGLSVIDVAHDRDDRRSVDEFLGFVLRLLDNRLVVKRDYMDCAAVFLGEDGRCVGVDLLVDRRHDAEGHQLRDELRRLDVHLLGELRDGDILHDVDLLGDRHRSGFGLLLELEGLLGLVLALVERRLAPGKRLASRSLAGEGRRA